MKEIERLKDISKGRDDLEQLLNNTLDIIKACEDLESVTKARISILGKKGTVAGIFKKIPEFPYKDRPLLGEFGNLLKKVAEQELDSKEKQIRAAIREKKLAGLAIDVTLPGRGKPLGRRHILNMTIREIVSIFLSLGYRVIHGPEVELDYYNFEALNTPTYHPARSLQDTFYFKRDDPVKDSRDDVLLRTHTSPVQVRVMESTKPPLYVISPGKAYRRDEIDATHSAVFHQVEGFAVDRGITMGDLKGTLEVFAKKLFGEEKSVRFRPHFFPFTEPSAEVDVSCFACDTAGCSLCKGVGWLEIMGCGMIDPNVFSYVGYDPEEYQGFAFGMGVERIAMMKHGIDDMRLFYENDVRFLRQFHV